MAIQDHNARPDPDALLASAERHHKGKFKIFLGAAPGVGKTWEMLAAAQEKKDRGVDVVAGLIETHGRAGTIQKMGALELLPRLSVPYKGQNLEEFDLDGALNRHPDLLLVDELAHTNAPGLRHTKRWQDIQELIEAGINVWSTVNVQHLESLNDQVARITGVRVAETIPDTVLDMADEIELIDLPPADLRARLQEGHIYRPDVASRALKDFFREGNLGALREMALRRAAQRIDKDVALYMRARAIPGPWPVAERVLALIGADASASNVVRHAARLAEALRAPLTAFHIERENDDARVQTALDLAVQLGANVVSQSTSDIVRAVLDYAAQNNITHIVMGRHPKRRWRFGRRLAEALTRESGSFSLHFVPVPAISAPSPGFRHAPPKLKWEPYIISSLLLAAVTIIGNMAHQYVPQEATGLVFTAVIVAMASRYGRNAGLFNAIIGFLLWNFCFLSPLGGLSVSDPRDVVVLLIFLMVGLLTGQLAGKVRQEAGNASARVEALRRISLFGQRFSRAATLTDVLTGAAEEIAGITGVGVVLLDSAQGLNVEAGYPEGTTLGEADMAAAEWCFKNGVETGLGTATLPSVSWRFLPLKTSAGCIGVLGALPKEQPSPPQAQTLATLAGQTALAVERARLSLKRARAEAKEDSQKLRNALLTSLSHDLRTPLTSIRGAAETLYENGDALDDATKADLLTSITQDTARMTKFIANITDMARIEGGGLTPRQERVKLEEVAEAAVAGVAGAIYTRVNIAPEAAYALADPALLEQILVNLLDNAVKYAPPGSHITISSQRAGDKIQMSVADAGVGIPPEELDAVFDSFFRAHRGDRVAPGTGLGLAIAKSFAEVMGGQIKAISPRTDLPADGLPGTIITIELPAA